MVMVLLLVIVGDIRDVGIKAGKYYSVNVPLQEGIDDASYQTVFKPVMEKVRTTVYAVVLLGISSSFHSFLSCAGDGDVSSDCCGAAMWSRLTHW